MPSSPFLPSLLVVVVVLLHATSAAATFRFDLHHRFSTAVRRWAESRAWEVGDWPEPGSVEYYAALIEHDRRNGRRLASADPALTFSDGNATVRINKLGFLHYAEVSVGTPSVSFLVALDTGSDLFWVPCDCKSCATSQDSLGANFELGIYSLNSSLTSKNVGCFNPLCELQSACSAASDLCPYKVAYISSETSSSGVLVEDILYLTTEDTRQEAIEARVMFGCGQVQTGSFLDSAAPNGLFGLGMEKISVPSMLASAGLIADSFSMCFGRDGIGRISFGDKGSSDQEETPFTVSQSHSPTYVVSISGLQVGNSYLAEDFFSLVDSGTSFTTLADPAYTSLSESFNSQVHDQQRSPDAQVPFEYCYLISSNQTNIPAITLIMKGGSQFPVTNPIIFISTPVEVMYCLAIIRSQNLNIIGQNFMTGLCVVFDREKLVFGWKPFDCYDMDDHRTLPITRQNTTTKIPPTTIEPKSYDPEDTKQDGNSRQISVVQPSPSWSRRLIPSTFGVLSSLFLLVNL